MDDFRVGDIVDHVSGIIRCQVTGYYHDLLEVEYVAVRWPFSIHSVGAIGSRHHYAPYSLRKLTPLEQLAWAGRESKASDGICDNDGVWIWKAEQPQNHSGQHGMYYHED